MKFTEINAALDHIAPIILQQEFGTTEYAFTEDFSGGRRYVQWRNDDLNQGFVEFSNYNVDMSTGSRTIGEVQPTGEVAHEVEDLDVFRNDRRQPTAAEREDNPKFNYLYPSKTYEREVGLQTTHDIGAEAWATFKVKVGGEAANFSAEVEAGVKTSINESVSDSMASKQSLDTGPIGLAPGEIAKVRRHFQRSPGTIEITLKGVFTCTVKVYSWSFWVWDQKNWDKQLSELVSERIEIESTHTEPVNTVTLGSLAIGDG